MVDAVFSDDFCDVWSFEVGVNGVVRHVPRCVYDEMKIFLLSSLDEISICFAGASPELSYVCQYWFDDCFVY